METGATHDREDPRVQCHRCLTFRYYDTITRGAHPCVPTQGWRILEDRIAELERENSVIRGEAAMESERLNNRILDHECQINRMAESIREHRTQAENQTGRIQELESALEQISVMTLPSQIEMAVYIAKMAITPPYCL